MKEPKMSTEEVEKHTKDATSGPGKKKQHERS